MMFGKGFLELLIHLRDFPAGRTTGENSEKDGTHRLCN